MNEKIPQFLYNKLINHYGNEITEEIINGYSKKRFVTLRVNTIKSTVENVTNILKENNITYNEV